AIRLVAVRWRQPEDHIRAERLHDASTVIVKGPTAILADLYVERRCLATVDGSSVDIIFPQDSAVIWPNGGRWQGVVSLCIGCSQRQVGQLWLIDVGPAFDRGV